MRVVGSISVVLTFVLLTGCGGGGSSSSTAGGSDQAKAGETSTTKSKSAHVTTPMEQQKERSSEAASEAEEALAEVEDKEGEENSEVGDQGSYNGINLCDLEQIEEEVRGLYQVDPSTEVICKPAKSQADVVAAWNWWVVQPPNHFRTPETKAEAEQQEQLEELVGEKATSERVEIGIADNHVRGQNVWATEKAHTKNPVNQLALIEVNGREAIWGANYLLLTPISEDQNLVVATLGGYTQSGPVDGEPTAISLAELVESEAF
ncbi:MAG TPA: hypothetical protein VGI17_09105 [Solirubrobacterales bacterium]|jgi:hypothetical protein